MHNSTEEVEIIVELLDDFEYAIVIQAVKSLGWPGARVKKFTRFGFSGSKILVLRREPKPGVPQILKIAQSEDIRKEAQGILFARHLVRGVRLEPDQQVKVPGVPVQGYLYDLQESKNGSDGVEDLDDVYEICLRNQNGNLDHDYVSTRLTANLKMALSRFDQAHTRLEGQGNETYGELFSRYRRERHASRVDHLFDENPDGLHIHGKTIEENPLGSYYEDLQRRKVTEFRVNLVHGDLHLSNIVLSDHIGLDLIDFAWAHQRGHLFLDYVMLESSMRFKAFPRDVNPIWLLEIDKELNRTLLGQAVDIVNLKPDNVAKRRIKVMTEAVMTVRQMLFDVLKSEFKNVSDSEIDTEYQRVMYLILAGQQKFPSFPLMRTTINLHLLREALQL